VSNDASNGVGNIWVRVLVDSNANKLMWCDILVQPLLCLLEKDGNITISSVELLERYQASLHCGLLLAEPHDLVLGVSDVLWSSRKSEELSSNTLLHNFLGIIKLVVPVFELLEVGVIDSVAWKWVFHD